MAITAASVAQAEIPGADLTGPPNGSFGFTNAQDFKKGFKDCGDKSMSFSMSGAITTRNDKWNIHANGEAPSAAGDIYNCFPQNNKKSSVNQQQYDLIASEAKYKYVIPKLDPRIRIAGTLVVRLYVFSWARYCDAKNNTVHDNYKFAVEDWAVRSNETEFDPHATGYQYGTPCIMTWKDIGILRLMDVPTFGPAGASVVVRHAAIFNPPHDPQATRKPDLRGTPVLGVGGDEIVGKYRSEMRHEHCKKQPEYAMEPVTPGGGGTPTPPDGGGGTPTPPGRGDVGLTAVGGSGTMASVSGVRNLMSQDPLVPMRVLQPQEKWRD